MDALVVLMICEPSFALALDLFCIQAQKWIIQPDYCFFAIVAILLRTMLWFITMHSVFGIVELVFVTHP